MKLWTIQSLARWERLQRDGVLQASRFDSELFNPSAYLWMTDELKKRVGEPPEGAAVPLWAWYQWQGTTRARPDLRARAHVEKGEKAVRLEIEVPDHQVLLSDFQLWHIPLNSGVLARTEAEVDAFDAELAKAGLAFKMAEALMDPDFGPRIRKGWELIFDLEFSDPYFTCPMEEKSIQAVFWQLRLEQVRAVTHFSGR
ncbi:MAG TPA: DUF3841 domain-containing protein [Candidatus Obscuribacterales bacterium]